MCVQVLIDMGNCCRRQQISEEVCVRWLRLIRRLRRLRRRQLYFAYLGHYLQNYSEWLRENLIRHYPTPIQEEERRWRPRMTRTGRSGRASRR